MGGASNIAIRPRRFITLDALRGAGAIIVMAGHLGIILGGYIPFSFMLAVDMFFVLSGFVLAHVYDGRFASGMTVKQFLKARIFRLYPIYFVGLLAGVVSIFFYNPHLLNIRTGIETTLLTTFALPTPPLPPYRALFPLNGPMWSLFFEFWIANVLFAVFWRWLRGPILWAVISVSAITLAISALHFHTLDFGSDWPRVIPGIPRVCFSFFAGVALARYHATHPPTLKVPSLFCLAVFAVVMMAPIKGTVITPCFQLAAVLFVFPALIYWGAEAKEKKPALGKAMGDVSYDIYVIHRPLIYIMVSPLGALPFPHSHKLETVLIQLLLMAVVVAIAWGTSRVLTVARASRRGLLKPPIAEASKP
jgi:peptidoglycan/LPS O-acetylase OafA/YrhL